MTVPPAFDLAFDLALCGLLLAVAAGVVAGRGTFRALVLFIVLGVLVALGWTRLDAIDVALAEIAIGAGLTGVLLLTAHGRLRQMGALAAPPKGAGRHIAGGLAGGGLAVALGWAWLALPPPPEGPGPMLARALPDAGVGNPVTAVLLNFRAWDTLLESVVLLVALVGAWGLARDAHWPGPAGLPQHARPGGVMAGFGRALPPVGLMAGMWLVWAGAEGHGGAFQGGTVLAAVALLALLAGITAPPRLSAPGWRAVLVAGPGVFVLSGLAGAALAGGFLVLPPALAKPAILVIEAALALSIAVTLALLVLGPPAGQRAAGQRAERQA